MCSRGKKGGKLNPEKVAAASREKIHIMNPTPYKKYENETRRLESRRSLFKKKTWAE